MSNPVKINDALQEIRNRYGLWSEADEKRIQVKRAAEGAAYAAWLARNPEQDKEDSEESE